jgi:hypothetical protein
MTGVNVTTLANYVGHHTLTRANLPQESWKFVRWRGTFDGGQQ